MIPVKWSTLVILPLSLRVTYPSGGQQQAGSLAGAAPYRKNICRVQRQAHSAWKSEDEYRGKSLSDCFSKSKKSRAERLAQRTIKVF